MKNVIKQTILLLFVVIQPLKAANPFNFSLHMKNRQKQEKPFKKAAKTPAPKLSLKSESPLEQELLELGKELQEIAEQLAKALGAQEVKQEIDKKIAEKQKNSGAHASKFKSRGPGGGGYRPRSFGRNASFGNKSKSFSPGGFNRPHTAPSSTGSGFFSQKNPEKEKTPTSAENKAANASRAFYPQGKNKKDKSSEDTSSTKLENTYKSYVETLAKAVSLVTKENNPQQREVKLQSIDLTAANKFFEEMQSLRNNIKPEEMQILEKSDNWKKISTQLKSLQSQITPVLIDLLLPLHVEGIAKIPDTQKTFSQLDLGHSLSKNDLQTIILKRGNKLHNLFARQAKDNPGSKKALGDALQRIINAYPAGLTGVQLPIRLTKLAAHLNKDDVPKKEIAPSVAKKGSKKPTKKKK